MGLLCGVGGAGGYCYMCVPRGWLKMKYIRNGGTRNRTTIEFDAILMRENTSRFDFDTAGFDIVASPPESTGCIIRIVATWSTFGQKVATSPHQLFVASTIFIPRNFPDGRV